VAFRLPGALAAEHRALLERTARTCPVALSLKEDIRQEVSFVYNG
jgi:hypothetical protein